MRLSDINILPLHDKRVGSLSDHAAVEATFIVNKSAQTTK